MVKTIESKKIVNVKVSKSNKPKESKAEAFLRIAKPRIVNILKSLRILGNCSKRNNYEYNQEQINKIYETLQDGLDTMISKFTPSKKEQESFEF